MLLDIRKMNVHVVRAHLFNIFGIGFYPILKLKYFEG